MTTIYTLIAEAIDQLSAAGVDTPRLDAELLLAHLLGTTRAWLWAHVDDPLSPQMLGAFHRLLSRRLRREPLPYLLGAWEFYGRPFTVTPQVLIPRPETELLVELVLDWARAHHAATIADIGTGSGIIAITLAAEMPALRLFAIDLSAAALAVARTNAERYGVAKRITFLAGDLLQPLATVAGAQLDAVVANLPYIAEEEFPALMPEVRDYEPREALLAGEGGLALIRRLLRESVTVVRPRGLLAIEVGQGQAQRVAELLTTAGWEQVHIYSDYGGIPRHVSAESPDMIEC